MQDSTPHKGKFTQGLLDHANILAALRIQPGQVVLDAGCGNGYMAEIFAEAVTESGKVYALDNNPNFIATLKDRGTPANLEAIQGDITRPTPMQTDSLDLIYIATVTHIFSKAQMEGFVRETARLLKPGGRLAIVEIEKRETPFGPPLERRYSPKELTALIPMQPEGMFKAGEYFYMQIFGNTKTARV